METVSLKELVLATGCLKNLQGVSGTHYRTRDAVGGFVGGETAYHDKLTWLRNDGVVLCEMEGQPDALIPVFACVKMTPTKDLSVNGGKLAEGSSKKAKKKEAA